MAFLASVTLSKTLSWERDKTDGVHLNGSCFFLQPTGYKFTCFCRILSAFTLENNFKNFCRIRSSRSNPAKAISGHNYTTIFLKKCIISILWFSNFHKQHRFTKKLRNDSFNICVSCLNLILLFLNVDVVLEPKTFVLTEVQTHNPGHSTQCSEPSVIPLSYPGAPITLRLKYFAMTFWKSGVNIINKV